MQQIAIEHRHQIIQIFKLIYFLLLAFLGFGFWAIYTSQDYQISIFNLGLWFGRVSILLFTIVLLPGIASRFQIRHPVFNVIRLYRRYLGILVYLLVMAHSVLVFTVFNVKTGTLPTTLPLFILFGLAAHLLLLPLFLTSNDKSVQKLGRWWGRIHKLIYVIAWLAFGHVALQRWSIWSVTIGTAAVLETISLIWKFIKFKLP